MAEETQLPAQATGNAARERGYFRAQRDQGLCGARHCKAVSIDNTYCTVHRERKRKWVQDKRAAFKAAAVCMECGVERVGNSVYCNRHRAKAVARGVQLDRRWYSLNRSAVLRNLTVTISKEEFACLSSQACFYGGASCKTRVGLDRLNNNEGYQLSNVVPCCAYHNQMRMDKLTPMEVLLIEAFRRGEVQWPMM